MDESPDKDEPTDETPYRDERPGHEWWRWGVTPELPGEMKDLQDAEFAAGEEEPETPSEDESSILLNPELPD